jgi:hypothetical protein
VKAELAVRIDEYYNFRGLRGEVTKAGCESKAFATPAEIISDYYLCARSTCEHGRLVSAIVGHDHKPVTGQQVRFDPKQCCFNILIFIVCRHQHCDRGAIRCGKEGAITQKNGSSRL